MAKRFTDTAIWDKAWFRKLSPRLKETWRYLCDKCDHAGIWEIDMEALTFNVGEQVTFQEIIDILGSRLNCFCEEKVFIPGFIDFQYKCSVENLNPENKVHKSVIDRLKKYGLFKPLESPLKGDKDKDKDKDKDSKKNISDPVDSRKKEIIEKVNEGLIRMDQYLLEFPELELREDAIEVIEFMRKTKNPNSKLPPDRIEIEKLIHNWLIPSGISKEDLLKMIRGASTSDFERALLQVSYILKPEHRAKLLSLEENIESSEPGKREIKESEKQIRYPKNHGKVAI